MHISHFVLLPGVFQLPSQVLLMILIKALFDLLYSGSLISRTPITLYKWNQQMESNGPLRVHLLPFVHCQSYTPVWGHLEPTQGHFETHWCSRVFPVSQHAQYQHPDSV